MITRSPGRNTAAAHWEAIYATNAETQVSWYQETPAVSLALIQEAAPDRMSRILDVGGGASVLVDHLLALGYTQPAVLDLSEAALARARERLGSGASAVNWIVGDVTREPALGCYDVWHDRAVFHFLIEEEDRRKYRLLAERTVRPGGHLIIATFAPDGPDRCSGLPVRRYDAEMLAGTLGEAFVLQRSLQEVHRTPSGSEQRFVYALFRRE